VRPFDDVRPGINLRVLASLKAATDFGLEPAAAADIARRCDPRTHGFEQLVDTLATALVERGLLRLPSCVDRA
jgi:hypothetical protein